MLCGILATLQFYELLGLRMIFFIEYVKCMYLLRYGKRGKEREEIHLVLYSIKVNHNIASNVTGYLCVNLNWEFA